MNTNHLILMTCIVVMGLALSACGAGPVVIPTVAPTMTHTLPPPTLTATALPTVTSVPPTSTPASDKQIKLIYMEKNKPTAGKTIWFSFYDEKKKNWVTSSSVTEQNGTAIFNVPEGMAGESYTFTYAYSEEKVNKNTAQIMEGTMNGLRIPPDPSQKSLTLKLYGVDISVEDGSIQLWQPK